MTALLEELPLHAQDHVYSGEGGNIKASRVKGSVRQLFQLDRKKQSEEEDYLLRPNETRFNAGLADKLKLMDVASSSLGKQDIERISMPTIDKAKFRKTFLSNPATAQPVVLTNSTLDFEWPAGEKHWNPDALELLLGSERRMEVAQTDSTVSLGDYIAYMKSPECAQEDNPVYVFETLVSGEHDDVIDKFNVPRPFSDLSLAASGCHSPGDTADLLSEAGDDGLLFGIHRWLILGPARSGSNVHIDPLGTSAWNTLCCGRKLWVLFPPGTPEEALQLPVKAAAATYTADTSDTTTTASEGNKEQPPQLQPQPPNFCAAGWFASVLPNLSSEVLEKCCQFVQHSNETVFVPAGWAHAVLNLDATVCVTQNFASPSNYTEVARCLYSSTDPENAWMVDEWREGVLNVWPQLQHVVETFCVHCSENTRGNTCALLDDRPVCIQCEQEREEQYEVISEQQVQDKYPELDIRHLPEDETPPCILRKDPKTKKKTKFFLHANIRDCLAGDDDDECEEEGEEDEEDCDNYNVDDDDDIYCNAT